MPLADSARRRIAGARSTPGAPPRRSRSPELVPPNSRLLHLPSRNASRSRGTRRARRAEDRCPVAERHRSEQSGGRSTSRIDIAGGGDVSVEAVGQGRTRGARTLRKVSRSGAPRRGLSFKDRRGGRACGADCTANRPWSDAAHDAAAADRKEQRQEPQVGSPHEKRHDLRRPTNAIEARGRGRKAPRRVELAGRDLRIVADEQLRRREASGQPIAP